MTAAAQAAGYADPEPYDPLLAAILAGHGAPPVTPESDRDVGDFCVNRELFDGMRIAEGRRTFDAPVPGESTHADRQYLSRVMRSQDAARAGGRVAYSIPRRVVATSLDTRQQVRRQVPPGRRRKLDPGVRARQRDRYKRAAADSLDAYGRAHLLRTPRAPLWRPRWLDHRRGCHAPRCSECARITIPRGRRAPRRHGYRGGTISLPAWLLDRAAAMRGCREAVGLLDRTCGGILVVPQSCRVRTCPDCESSRQAKVVAAYAGAVTALDPERVRFLTLTLVNVPRGELAAGLAALSGALGKLQRRALWRGGRCRDRVRCGMSPDPERAGWRLPHPPVTAALSSIEVTYNAERKTWHPHVHVLLESGYLPQAELAEVWEALTGDSRIVWVESVRRHAEQRWAGDVAGALRELLKYAAKPAPAFLDPVDGGVLAELLVALRGRHLSAASGSLYGLEVEDDAEPADLVLVLPDDPAADPYRAPRICPLHGGVADWAVHGYLARRECRAVPARAGPLRAVLSWSGDSDQERHPKGA